MHSSKTSNGVFAKNVFQKRSNKTTGRSRRFVCYNATAMITATLVYIFDRENRVLLAMKKRGHGEGYWNGPGGKLEPGESPELAAQRETQEEVGIAINTLEKRGEIEFVYTDKTIRTHIFVTDNFSGTAKETEEMLPKWFTLDTIPWDSMWPSDKVWLADLLNGKNIHLRMFFNEHTMYTHAESLD